MYRISGIFQCMKSRGNEKFNDGIIRKPPMFRNYFTCYYFYQPPGLVSKLKQLLTSLLLNQP